MNDAMKTLAQDWLASQCDSKGVIPNAPSRTASLAALLREVSDSVAVGLLQRTKDEIRRGTLAEVRRVVEDERRSWPHLVPLNATICDEQAVCDEILSRLDKL